MRPTLPLLNKALLLGTVICATLLVTTPSPAEARCTGRDLRAELAPEMQQRLQQEAARVPFSQGNHWVAQKDGRSLHVVGTQHSGDPRMRSVMRSLGPVIRDMDLVLLEVTAAQIAAQPTAQEEADQSRFFLLPKGQRLDQLMSQEDWAFLVPHLLQAGIDPQAALSLQPWVLADLVGPLGCLERGFGRKRGLDDRIERQAQRARVPVAGLEDTEAGLAALSAMPLRDQARMLILDLRSDTDHGSLARTQSAAYFEERLTEGRILLTWALYWDQDVSRREVRALLRAMDKEVLDARNRAWMAKIQRQTEDRIMIAVGAAHLPGQEGLLNLLAKSGWTLTRAAF